MVGGEKIDIESWEVDNLSYLMGKYLIKWLFLIILEVYNGFN